MYIRLRHCRSASNSNTSTQQIWFYDSDGSFIPWNHTNIVQDQFNSRNAAVNEDYWAWTTNLSQVAPPYGGVNPYTIINLSSVSKL